MSFSNRPTWSPPSSPDFEDRPVLPTNDRGMVTRTAKRAAADENADRKTPLKKARRSIQYVSRHFATQQPEEEGLRKPKKRRSEEEKENVVHQSDNVMATKISKKKRKSSINSGKDVGSSKRTKTSSTGRTAVQQDRGGKTAQVEDKLQSPVSDPKITEEKQVDLAPWQQVLALPPEEQQQAFHRIFYGLNVDALSSDSDLTDVPADIGPDPFFTPKPRKKRKSSRISQTKEPGSSVVAVKEIKTTPKTKPKSKRD